MTLDNFVPFNSRFIDVGAGGPAPFTFTATANVTWLKLTPNKGSVSSNNPEVRVEATVDWDALAAGNSTAVITFNSASTGQPPMTIPVTFIATKNTVPGDFHGMSIWSH